MKSNRHQNVQNHVLSCSSLVADPGGPTTLLEGLLGSSLLVIKEWGHCVLTAEF